MTFQAISAATPLVSEMQYVPMDDVSEARRYNEMQGRHEDNPEGLSNEFDELDRDAFGGVFS